MVSSYLSNKPSYAMIACIVGYIWAIYGNLDLYTGFGALYGSVYGYLNTSDDLVSPYLYNKPSYVMIAYL